MNPSDTLTVLFSHNLWANSKLIDLCVGLNDEQLDATTIGGYGSIRATLQHIVTAERSYLSRISTGMPFRRPEDAPPLTLAEIKEWAQASGQSLIEWAPKVQASDKVEINWDETIIQVPKTILLTQSINHATEHRSQIMAILTSLGIEPPELDGWSYFDVNN